MADDMRWDAPGPGRWEIERSHGNRTITPLFRDDWAAREAAGFMWASARFGAPLSHPELKHVNGWPYMRIKPVIEPKGSKPPPSFVLWTLLRLVPELRRRNKQAVRMFGEKLWREDVERWRSTQRPQFLERNLALQAEDISSYDDGALADHLERAYANLMEGYELHFRLHGTDIFVPGDFLAHVEAWGIDPAKAVELLRGSSPASAETAAQVKAIADALDAAGVEAPSSLAEVRAASPAAADALESYLRLHGWRMVTDYDIDGRTLHELPELVLGAIAAARGRADSAPDAAADPTPIRDQVPPEHRATFDELLADAREAYGVRDDNVGITGMWPAGLVRRVVLEAGRRLAARGRVDAPEHLYECSHGEIAAVLRGAAAPTAAELTQRAHERARYNSATPPEFLGPEEPPPPLDLLPAGLRRSGLAALTYANLMFQDKATRQRLKGSGIGSAPYTGRARVAADASDAIARLEPGDVLVTGFTTPAYNAVLPVCGGLVVEEGGALSHAAIVAREFGIPAVIGAHEARTAIADGDLVEVDPVSGEVRVLERAR